MKTNKDFNLSKDSKRALAVIPRGLRSCWKKMLIESEVMEKRAKLAKVKEFKGE